MIVVETKVEINKLILNYNSKNLQVGLVPTMGALHEGHLALVRRALDENDRVFVSIFVNPTQFDKKEDLDKYPRTLNADIKLLESLSKDRIVVYAPSPKDIYDDKIIAGSFDFDGLEFEMEGRFRNGHFNGVGTIVKQLLEITKPHRAYFGEKDFQQLQIIKKLVQKFDLTVEIVGCKIYREKDGLAMSSRNVRLTLDHRNAAPFIFKTLKAAKVRFKNNSAQKVEEWVRKEFSSNELLDLEYFIIADVESLKQVKRKSKKKHYRAFIAAYADKIRLIDNIALN